MSIFLRFREGVLPFHQGISDIYINFVCHNYLWFALIVSLNNVLSFSMFYYISGDPDSSSSKPFELLGTSEGSSGGENILFSTFLSFKKKNKIPIKWIIASISMCVDIFPVLRLALMLY